LFLARRFVGYAGRMLEAAVRLTAQLRSKISPQANGSIQWQNQSPEMTAIQA